MRFAVGAQLLAEPGVTYYKAEVPRSGGLVVSSIVRAPQLSSYTFLPKQSTHKWLLGATLGLVISALACGSNGGSFVPVKGSFSTASLSGSYTYALQGIDINGNQFTEGGVFTADGNGKITSGTDDFNQSGQFGSNPITGIYQIIPDGSGTITFTLTSVPAPNNTFQFAVNLVNTSQLYIAENDSFFSASGIADKQDSAAVTTTPNGTFAVRVHAYGTPNGPVGTVGQVVSTSGTVTGNADILRNGTMNAVTLSGSFQAPDTTGRGILTYVDHVSNITANYEYYIINASTIRLLGTDANVLSLGRAELQNGGPFNAGSLSGSYAFGTVGNLSTNDGGLTRTVGQFTAGGGSISTGAYDAVINGNVVANNPLQTPAAGSYTVSGSGETQLTLNPSGGVAVQEILWLVSPSRAFVLVNDSTKLEDGTVDLQTTSSFTNSNLSGQYGLVMEGFVLGSNNYLTRVGTLIPDGNGNVTLNELVNAFTTGTGASFNSPSLTGTYTVGSNGRVAATIVPSTSPNIDLVLYMVSPNQAYILQGDTGFEVSGSVALQSSP